MWLRGRPWVLWDVSILSNRSWKGLFVVGVVVWGVAVRNPHPSTFFPQKLLKWTPLQRSFDWIKYNADKKTATLGLIVQRRQALLRQNWKCIQKEWGVISVLWPSTNPSPSASSWQLPNYASFTSTCPSPSQLYMKLYQYNELKTRLGFIKMKLAKIVWNSCSPTKIFAVYNSDR